MACALVKVVQPGEANRGACPQPNPAVERTANGGVARCFNQGRQRRCLPLTWNVRRLRQPMIRFALLNTPTQRWFGKSAKYAAETLSTALSSAAETFDLQLSGEFDTTECDTTRVRLPVEKDALPTVTFAANSWSTLAEANHASPGQLAAAVLALCPSNALINVTHLFELRGVKPGPVEIIRETSVRPTGLIEFYVYIKQVPSVDSFFALASTLETELLRSRAGEVSGTSFPVAGGNVPACIDIVTRNRAKAEAVVARVLSTASIEAYEISA